ncbi:MAG: pyruvate/2-oxoglutarate dehydrogenase complex dihydrolipoamide acyltransferase (E2) component [Myxococcota bacterium]|jgi:pyruvate/2-oxoglutarate dehydrogenase complex dihydrolipoamide acyltransferase (E2) component
MPNIELSPQRLSTFRKVAIGTWRTTYDPSVYGTLRVRMDRAVAYIEAFRERTGKRLTITHLAAAALTRALLKMPDANCVLRFHKLYRRKEVSLSFQVVMSEGEGQDAQIDLSALSLRALDDKSLEQIVDEFNSQLEIVRARKDVAMEKTRGNFKKLPTWAIHHVLNVMSWISYTLNLDLSKLGVPRDPFGSAMVTNIGSLGMETAYAPLVPYARCPLILALGAVRDEPVVEDGQVVAGKMMGIHATFDHRIMDGMHASIMCRVMKQCFEDPEGVFGVGATPPTSPPSAGGSESEPPA